VGFVNLFQIVRSFICNAFTGGRLNQLNQHRASTELLACVYKKTSMTIFTSSTCSPAYILDRFWIIDLLEVFFLQSGIFI